MKNQERVQNREGNKMTKLTIQVKDSDYQLLLKVFVKGRQQCR
jgi:hypothetical protein